MAYDLKAVLEAEVIDKLIAVMHKEDQELKSMIAGMGTRVGSVATWDALPTVDQTGQAVTDQDTAVLTATDGNHPAGVYSRKADNSGWNDTPDINYDNLQISSLKADLIDGTLTVDAVTGNVTGTDDGVSGTALATALNALKSAQDTLYHPKGGNTTLKIVAAAADENTDEVVTANQLNATFTVAEVQAKYDAL